jgi:ABC-2 type transport system permease protein
VFSILKKEIISYLSSLVAYVTIGVFLLVLGLFLWVFPELKILPGSNIFDYGYAGLDSLFTIAPYLFLFLIPAITMRSIAEERKEGTIETLLTRPLNDWQIVLGKYLACLVIVFFALLPTLVYYITIYTLGAPKGDIDTGGVIGSYIGLFLLGACFCSIGLLASAITKNQIISFIIAVFLCFFIFAGFDLVGQLADSTDKLVFLQNLNLENWGITEHYESVSRGVLDTRDLCYFVIVTGLFICATLFVLIRQRQKSLKGNDARFCAAVLGLLIVVGIVSSLTFTRIDFTKEKRYTISNISQKIMNSIDAPVRVVVYFKGENFTSQMKRLQLATKDMLTDLQAYSHGQLQFEFVDPMAYIQSLPDSSRNAAFDALQKRGITVEPTSIKTDNGVTRMLVFPEALVSYGGEFIAVNLLQSRAGLSDEDIYNNSIQNLEYAFSSAIKKVISGGKPIVAFTEGDHELSDLQLADAMKSLSDGYQVGRVDLKKVPFDVLMKVKLLVIDKPDTPFTELEKFKVDQYLMRGGRILWAVDQVNAEMDSLRNHGGEGMSFGKRLNLDDQLFTYGVRINYDLIADLNFAQIPVTTGEVGGQAQIQMVPWPYYPLFIPASKHPVVKNLDAIKGEFTSSIDTLAIKNVKKTVLLSSSANSKTLNAPHIISLEAIEQEPTGKDFNGPEKIVAVLLEGKFTSDFLNRPVPDSLKGKVQPIPQSMPTKMIVMSDGDFFKNDIDANGQALPLGYDHYMRQDFGNKNLLLNIADYMADDSGLIGLRTKEVKIRLLDTTRIRSEKLYWQLFNNILPLALLLTFAIFQHYIRKRKYAY